ncbi:hypothetical protein GON22_06045 [Paenibacillus sp. MMS18-CY102]|nr:hypothetical protein [Paenibacillus sp. MMS18-CY102]
MEGVKTVLYQDAAILIEEQPHAQAIIKHFLKGESFLFHNIAFVEAEESK